MIWFVDTSALVKRYIKEQGSEWFRREIIQHNVLISQLTPIEMAAALSKRLQSFVDTDTVEGVVGIRLGRCLGDFRWSPWSVGCGESSQFFQLRFRVQSRNVARRSASCEAARRAQTGVLMNGSIATSTVLPLISWRQVPCIMPLTRRTGETQP